MMRSQFYGLSGLLFMGIAFSGCSRKVQTEEKKSVVEEETTEVKEVISIEQILANKFRSIVIPRIDFEDLTIEEAIDYLRLRAAELDTSEPNEALRGVSLVIGDTEGHEIPRINEIRVRNVSLSAALRYICLVTEMQLVIDDKMTLVRRDPKAAWNSFGSVLEEEGDGSEISEKLKTIIITRVDFEDTPLEEAMAYLRLKSAELHIAEIDPKLKGINFVTYVPKGMEMPVIDKLQMRDVPFEDLLKAICDKTGMRYELDQYSVILVPKDLK